jgi:hypothetical protein
MGAIRHQLEEALGRLRALPEVEIERVDQLAAM